MFVVASSHVRPLHTFFGVCMCSRSTLTWRLNRQVEISSIHHTSFHCLMAIFSWDVFLNQPNVLFYLYGTLWEL